MITLLCIFCLTGLYFIYRKLKSDERKKTKARNKTKKGFDPLSGIIDDYPTYHRNK